jgi:Protein of unknown function (DUF2914)
MTTQTVTKMLARVVLVAALAFAPAWAMADDSDLTDWLEIPDFAVEVTIGSGVDGKNLTGEGGAFAKNVGILHCRIDGIGLAEAQELTVVWYREDTERARQTVKLSKDDPVALTQLNIPAAQAGSWRVEVIARGDQVLAFAPFSIGRPSINPAPAPKGLKKQ